MKAWGQESSGLNRVHKGGQALKKVMGALFLFFSTLLLATPAHGELSDIGNSYARTEIEALWQKGYVTGYQDGTFRPGSNMTRAEFAAILARAMELPPDEASSSLFTDVPPWARPYVGALVAEKITNGISPHLFGSDSPLTREEMAVFFARAIGLDALAQSLDLVPPFSDQLSIHSWASPSVAFLKSIQFIKGSGNNYYPLLQADRQAIARLTYEYAFRFASYIPTVLNVTVKTEDPNASDVKLLDSENVQVTYNNGDTAKYRIEEIINGDYYYNIGIRTFQSLGFNGRVWSNLDPASKQQLVQIPLGAWRLTYSPYEVKANDDTFISSLVSALDNYYNIAANQTLPLLDSMIDRALANNLIAKKS